MNEVDKTRVMSPEEEARVAYRAAAGDEEAREKLVTSNLRFVLSVAKMYAGKPEDFPDLVAAGNEGLIEASAKFDPSRGFKFISFAVWYIRKEIIKYLTENSRTVKIPQNQSQLISKIIKFAGELSTKEGREISNEEAFDLLKSENPKYKSVDEKTMKKALIADIKTASLDAELNTDNDAGTLKELLPSEDFDSDEIVLLKNKREILEKIMCCLTDIEKSIVIRFFGFDDQSGFTDSLQSIGEDMDYTSESIRLKLRKAITKMRKYSIKNKVSIDMF